MSKQPTITPKYKKRDAWALLVQASTQRNSMGRQSAAQQSGPKIVPVITSDTRGKEQYWRPMRLDDFVGHKRIKQIVKHEADVASETASVMSNALFYGPPGCGKTTLAMIYASMNEAAGGRFAVILATTVDTPAQLAEFVAENAHQTIIIDEIHALKTGCGEVLYHAMEAGRTCFAGATTDTGALPGPLLDRFRMQIYIPRYSKRDTEKITKIHSEKMGMRLNVAARKIIAHYARKTPRYVVSLLSRIRNITHREAVEADAELAVKMFGMNKAGLTSGEVQYLLQVALLGGRASQSALQKSLGVAVSDIETQLIGMRLLAVSPRGREITTQGKAILKQSIEEDGQLATYILETYGDIAEEIVS